MKEYIVKYREITNKTNVSIKVTAEYPFEAHRKADGVMRKRSTTSYYWIDTIPADWL